MLPIFRKCKQLILRYIVYAFSNQTFVKFILKLFLILSFQINYHYFKANIKASLLFSAPPSYKTWLEQTHEVSEEMDMEIIDKENIRKLINYFNQINNKELII